MMKTAFVKAVFILVCNMSPLFIPFCSAFASKLYKFPIYMESGILTKEAVWSGRREYLPALAAASDIV
jgi:hypothetical protein